MIIDEIQPNKSFQPLLQQQNRNKGIVGTPHNDKFVDSLKELIGDVNNLQKESADLTEKMIKGEPVDLHDVMIASEKAKTGFQLILEMRNKFLDMYKEVSRIQV